MSEIDKTIINENFKKSVERLKNSTPVLPRGLSVNNLMPKLKCRWELIPNGDDEYYETECGVDIPYMDDFFKYCYNCGKLIKRFKND